MNIKGIVKTMKYADMTFKSNPSKNTFHSEICLRCDELRFMLNDGSHQDFYYSDSGYIGAYKVVGDTIFYEQYIGSSDEIVAIFYK